MLYVSITCGGAWTYRWDYGIYAYKTEDLAAGTARSTVLMRGEIVSNQLSCFRYYMINVFKMCTFSEKEIKSKFIIS